MSVIQVTGGSFALDRHGLHPETPFVAAARELAPPGEAMPLLLVADPVEPVPGAAEVAGDILHGMAVYLRHTMDSDISSALISAFRTANERVYVENQQRHGMRRLYLGLSCAVIRDDELFVAQCAPSQVLVWQDGLLHAIPSLNTWGAEEITETFSELSYPLGFHATIQPRISYSRCAPGDIVAVVSWPIARELLDVPDLADVADVGELMAVIESLPLRRDDLQAHGAVYRISGDDDQPGAGVDHNRKLPLDAAVDPRESGRTNPRERPYGKQVRRENDVHPTEFLPDHGSGAGSGFDTLGGGHPGMHGTDDLPDIRNASLGAADDGYTIELPSSPQFFTASQSSDAPDSVHATGPSHRYTPADSRRKRAGNSPRRKGHLVELFAGLLLSLCAAVVGVWQVTKRDRPIHGPRDDGTLGLPHLQRWSDTYHPPRFERLRRASPRFQFSGVVLVGVVVLAVSLVGLVVYTQVSGFLDDRNATIEAELQNIEAVRIEAASMGDQGAAVESLNGAMLALGELEADASDEGVLARIHEQQAAVQDALDGLTVVERLNSYQVMGAIPAPPEGVTPRLFQGGGNTYVFGDGLFELDPTSGALIHLLGAGDVVGGEAVGTLLAATWNDDRPLAVDASHAYMLEPTTGVWHRVPLGVFTDAGYSDIAAVAAFDRNIYYLTPESGQILKFDALDFINTPENWTGGAERERLSQAVDMVVDGRIHVALANGDVLTFFRSALESTLSVDVMPPLDSVRALSTGGGDQHFFLVNESDGRIICVDREGNVVRQFISGEDGPPLAGATDIVVNAQSGISHVLVGDTLYAVRLSVPQ